MSCLRIRKQLLWRQMNTLQFNWQRADATNRRRLSSFVPDPAYSYYCWQPRPSLILSLILSGGWKQGVSDVPTYPSYWLILVLISVFLDLAFRPTLTPHNLKRRRCRSELRYRLSAAAIWVHCHDVDNEQNGCLCSSYSAPQPRTRTFRAPYSTSSFCNRSISCCLEGVQNI